MKELRVRFFKNELRVRFFKNVLNSENGFFVSFLNIYPISLGSLWVKGTEKNTLAKKRTLIVQTAYSACSFLLVRIWTRKNQSNERPGQSGAIKTLHS